jgi:hypothetical protein
MSNEKVVADLQKKIDLLCKDLVGSNKQLAQSLGALRRLCDFQHEIMGENDLAYLLHRAIQCLIVGLAETNGAIFLCATRKFEAHISGSWQRAEVDLERMESILVEVVIDVSRKKSAVVLAGSERDGVDFSYAMMGLPILVGGELVGVAVFYRDGKDGFDLRDQVEAQSCLPSLGRQILAVQRLHVFVASKNF